MGHERPLWPSVTWLWQRLDPLLHLLIATAKNKMFFFRKGQRLIVNGTCYKEFQGVCTDTQNKHPANHLQSCLFLQLPRGGGPEAWNKLLEENIHTNLAPYWNINCSKQLSSGRDHRVAMCELYSRCVMDAGEALKMSVTVISSACHNVLSLAWLHITAQWEAERATGYPITTTVTERISECRVLGFLFLSDENSG